MVLRHCLDVEHEHLLWHTFVFRVRDVFAAARTVGEVVVLCPTRLDVKVLWLGGQRVLRKVLGEGQPRLGTTLADTTKVLVDVSALERVG